MNSRAMAIVLLLSMTIISQEIAWTRLFSAEFFYTFAFLVLSLAILGLGLGALAVRLVPALDRPGTLPVALTLTGLLTLAAPVLVFRIDPDFSRLFRSPSAIGESVLAVLVLGLPYTTGGMALATLFKRRPESLPRLYMADLVGAGAGVGLVIVAMNGIGTPAAAFACALPVLAAAFLAAPSFWRLVPIGLAAATVFLAAGAGTLLHKEHPLRGPHLYTLWDASAKVTVFEYDESARGIVIDNAANSPVYGFDGNWDRPDSLLYEFGIDVRNLIERLDHCTFLSLGAGGGTDVLQALQWGADEIHAVEVVPAINELMTSGDLALFTGHIYRDPRVIVATEDARRYVRRFRERFDVIYSLSSNTFAALASGAFAMAENYLFTVEAFEDYWRALSPDGFLSMEHQYYMPRLVSALMEALRRQGVEEPAAHFAVYDLPAMRRNLLLLSRRPLTDEIRNRAYGELTPEKHGQIHLLYPAADSLALNLINRIVMNGWRAEADSARVDISPPTDDRPYAAQMGLWRNLKWSGTEELRPFREVQGFPHAKLLVVTVLAVAIVLVTPLNFIPYARRGPKLGAVPWLYFFTIGVAFMMIEVVLIQKFAGFIGTSVASMATVLLTLLVFSGVGSRVSGAVNDRVPFLGILVWLMLDVLLFRAVTAGLGHLTLAPRILLSAAAIAPLGFFLGMPFPKGGLRVGTLIDWGFAVNGTASVIGSALVLLVAFRYGFPTALLAAAGLYTVAFGLLSARRRWPAVDSPRAG